MTLQRLPLLIVLVFASNACRKKHAPIELAAGIDVPATPKSFASDSVDPTALPSDALLNVSVTVNGKPVATWMTCSVSVYDASSNLSTRGKGECGKFVKFEPGLGDLSVTVTAGSLQTTERLPTRTWAAGTQMIPVEIQWPIGRVRLTRQPHPSVPQCRVSVEGVEGDVEADWVVAKTGTYTAQFACQDSRGSPFRVDARLEVLTDMDNQLSPAITPPSDTTRVTLIPGVPELRLPSAPSSSEQFPLTKDYTVVPPTPGQDLPAPSGPVLAPPQNAPLPVPQGEDLRPETRENP